MGKSKTKQIKVIYIITRFGGIMQEKLKVGDRVEVTKLCLSDKEDGVCVGDVGTILQIFTTGYQVKLDKASNTVFGMIYNQLKKMEENKMEFSKKDLKSGMVVELRYGSRLLVVEVNGKLELIGKNEWNSLSHRDENLKCTNREFDIVKVYKADPSSLERMLRATELIWERKEFKEMTIADIEKELGHPVKIVKE